MFGRELQGDEGRRLNGVSGGEELATPKIHGTRTVKTAREEKCME